jgi:hypothetical protein
MILKVGLKQIRQIIYSGKMYHQFAEVCFNGNRNGVPAFLCYENQQLHFNE